MSSKKDEAKCWIRSTVNWLRDGWPAAVAGGLIVILLITLERSLADGFWPETGADKDQSVLRANLGALGDIMGGFLNPFLTFISIVLLVQTIRISQTTLAKTEEALKISNKTLEATKEQVELNREELKANRVEVARASDAQEAISKTQEIQRAEAAFYNFLPSFNESVKRFEYSHSVSTDDSASTILHNLILSCDTKDKVAKCMSIRNLGRKNSVSFLLFIKDLTSLLIIASDNEHLEYIIFSRLNQATCFNILYYSWCSPNYEANIISDYISKSKHFRKSYFSHYHKAPEILKKVLDDI